MNRQCVNWRPVKCRNIKGENFDAELPKIIAVGYRGSLLLAISKMKKQKPIFFHEAVQILYKKIFDPISGHAIENSRWFTDHFVDWISDLGYHIELTGDEFELYFVPERVA